jgi:hypothetical protein
MMLFAKKRSIPYDILIDFYDMILSEEVIRNITQLCFRKCRLFEQIHTYFVNDLRTYRDCSLCADKLVCLMCLGLIALDRQRINPDIAIDKTRVLFWHSYAHTGTLAYNVIDVLKGAIIDFITIERRKGVDTARIIQQLTNN